MKKQQEGDLVDHKNPYGLHINGLLNFFRVVWRHYLFQQSLDA